VPISSSEFTVCANVCRLHFVRPLAYIAIEGVKVGFWLDLKVSSATY